MFIKGGEFVIEEYLKDDEGYTILDKNALILTSNGRIFKKVHGKGKTYDFVEVAKSVQGNYEYVMLKGSDNKIHRYYIHDLVYWMFKGFFDICFFRVVHKNGNTLDNRADNLEIKLKESYVEKYGDVVNLLDGKDGTILIME